MSNNIDEKIRQALSREDAAVFDEFEEESLFSQAMQLMTGRNRWLNFYAMVMTLVFMVVAGICLWQFILASDVKSMFSWALGLLFSAAAISMSKLWAWMEMEKNSTIREIKRLELQVAQLSQKLESNKESSLSQE